MHEGLAAARAAIPVVTWDSLDRLEYHNRDPGSPAMRVRRRVECEAPDGDTTGGIARYRYETAVFRGLDFRTFLKHDNGDRFGNNSSVLLQYWRDADDLLLWVPPHRNLARRPTAFVTIRLPEKGVDRPVLCGSLYPATSGRTLATAILDANAGLGRLSLAAKARYCLQMTEALCHVHSQGGLYHGDVKPASFELDADADNLRLTDWDRASYHTRVFQAPETVNPLTLCVREGTVTNDPAARPKLLYRVRDDLVANLALLAAARAKRPPTRGSEIRDSEHRQRRGLDAPCWMSCGSVWPHWIDDHPWAAQLAEVFSLGCTQFMLLSQHPDPYMTADEALHLPALQARLGLVRRHPELVGRHGGPRHDPRPQPAPQPAGPARLLAPRERRDPGRHLTWCRGHTWDGQHTLRGRR